MINSIPQVLKNALETINNNRQAAFIDYTIYDSQDRDTNRKIVASGYERLSENKKEFWIVNRDPLAVTIARGDLTLTAIRVLFHFVAYGGWDSCYRTTRADLSRRLKLSRPALNNAIKLLKERGIITEARDHGCTMFMINPDHATQGQNLTQRQNIFNALVRHQISEGFTPDDAQRATTSAMGDDSDDDFSTATADNFASTADNLQTLTIVNRTS